MQKITAVGKFFMHDGDQSQMLNGIVSCGVIIVKAFLRFTSWTLEVCLSIDISSSFETV